MPQLTPELNGTCAICGTPIHIAFCCSGRDCGCMGMPIEPPVCSQVCEVEYMNQLREQQKNPVHAYFTPENTIP